MYLNCDMRSSNFSIPNVFELKLFKISEDPQNFARIFIVVKEIQGMEEKYTENNAVLQKIAISGLFSKGFYWNFVLLPQNDYY